jgi:hypothetical protein
MPATKHKLNFWMIKTKPQIFAIGLLFLSCNSHSGVKVEKVTFTSVDTNTHVPIPTPPKALDVSAYLIYDDGSASSFDILNDKTKALWNTIIGEGDAEKPSRSVKIKITGQLSDLQVKIFNGKKKVTDQKLPDRNGFFDFIVKNTGCDIVRVDVTKNSKTVYQDSIEFHCGE